MINSLVKLRRSIALLFVTVMYSQFILAGHTALRSSQNLQPFNFSERNINNVVYNTKEKRQEKSIESNVKKMFTGGPTQPEMQAFSSVNNANMVDLFTGDFSYNIPLMDVGGYPINISYSSGITMDQEASWVGLGWNINPGTITRNMRGLPDDFDGGADTIQKTKKIRENKTVGASIGGSLEIGGFPNDDTKLGLEGDLGVFQNTYRGWGIETSFNPSINVGTSAKDIFTAGLSIQNNSQEGLTLSPSLSYTLKQFEADLHGSAGLSSSLAYNSRTGLRGLQLGLGVTQYTHDKKNQEKSGYYSSRFSSGISFAYPTFLPSIGDLYTSTGFTFTARIGSEAFALNPAASLTGYVATQEIAKEDQVRSLPAYGFLHFYEGSKDSKGLLDFNREKEIPYREKPAVPSIALPYYTPDVFSITGEGTGGMFRAYRGDIGFVHDSHLKTKDNSGRLSVDLGFGNIFHGGVDLNLNRTFSETDAWRDGNLLSGTVDFKKSSQDYEAVYFRNPSEKTINSTDFYNSIGDDDLVSVELTQAGLSNSIKATNYLNRFKNNAYYNKTLLSSVTAQKTQRDKRAQVISYLNAEEASLAATSKYIENYEVNKWGLQTCNDGIPRQMDNGQGLEATFFDNEYLEGVGKTQIIPVIDFYRTKSGGGNLLPSSVTSSGNNFSAAFIGRLYAPESGPYTLSFKTDDGVRLWLNDSLLIDYFHNQSPTTHRSPVINLVKDNFYKLRIEYFQGKGRYNMQLFWQRPGKSDEIIDADYLYQPEKKTSFKVPGSPLTLEKRVNEFRQPNHISEINVLNADGRRYIYGIPVYNLKQKDVSFSVNHSGGNAGEGLAKYTKNVDNSLENEQGKEHLFTSEATPAYAHSFLLTQILSHDYVDVNHDGITDDDLGDAIKFNYSKVCGIDNPYNWRAPYVQDSASYQELLRTYDRDDKANYVFGQKELWYLNSIVSKNMIATFTVIDRDDLLPITENGEKKDQSHTAKKLDRIDLYSKADFIKHGTNAVPVKTVHFEYTHELCRGINRPVNDSGKLTLKKIWFTYNGNDKGKQNPYIFTYGNANPPYNISASDRWGSYKHPLQNPGSSASNLIGNSDYSYSVQDSTVAAQNAAAWTLSEILLPSKGRMEITYESDDYAYVQNKRAATMFKIAGFSKSASFVASDYNKLYSDGDNLYVLVKVPQAVSNKKEIFEKYLEDISKFYCKLFVKMPSDEFGSGSEFVPCYFRLSDETNNYGVTSDPNMIWLKMEAINREGKSGGNYSPCAQAAIQFLRLNLPSKAYPGSEVSDDLDLDQAIRLIGTMGGNIINAFSSFSENARKNYWAQIIDTSRSFIRLNDPDFKKYGGGLRVKRVKIYDNWESLTKTGGANGEREAVYGQEYDYTTIKNIHGTPIKISSGVASYEPIIGGDENPFHIPIEYLEQVAPLAPVSLGYIEEPLGESLFPAPSVGYSVVKVRSVNRKNIRSVNGYEETGYYTSYDFPTLVDRTSIDGNAKKRYKPGLANFLKIDAKHYLNISQGFKIELNDMHGKMKYQASYAETDTSGPVTSTQYFYKVDNANASFKQLSNTATVIAPDGSIDTTAVIGKDIELMADMRQQRSVTNGNNFNVNADFFSFPFPPVFVLPSFFGLAQREENLFRTAALTKVIHRSGILDSVVQMDKGSVVSVKNLLYDRETGEALLTSTINEFEDPVFNFSYPSHWFYDGMGPAYKNIDVILDNLNMLDGRIISGLPLNKTELDYFTGGDEVLVASREKTAAVTCPDASGIATFPTYTKLWTINTQSVNGSAAEIYFVDKNGKPFTSYNMALKIIRSGRRNINGSIGSITSLVNPLKKSGSNYSLNINNATKVINANAIEFKELWKTANSINCSACPEGSVSKNGLCIKSIAPLFIADSSSYAVCYASSQAWEYSSCGSYIYSSFNTDRSEFVRSPIDPSNLYWINPNRSGYCVMPPENTSQSLRAPARLSLRDSSLATFDNVQSKSLVSPNISIVTNQGPLNRVGIWVCQAAPTTKMLPQGQWKGFVNQFNTPSTGLYYIGAAADNRLRLRVDNALLIEDKKQPATDNTNFSIWHLYPIELTQGVHTIQVEGYNEVTSENYNPASIGVEIYANTEAELRAAQNDADLNIIFSTKNLIGTSQPSSGHFACPEGFALDSTYGTYSCDSVVNPVSESNFYNLGLLGNFRAQKSYVYYDDRSETNPATSPDIKRFGTISNFAPFWNFNSNKLVKDADTLKWVWNAEAMLYNRKGYELENRDPLGRYNSGQYGYGNALPVSVVQNSPLRESAFEGFEDYDFGSQICDDVCAIPLHWDFSANADKIVNDESHTGKKSLLVAGGTSVSNVVRVKNSIAGQPVLGLTKKTSICPSFGGNTLDKISADTSALLPSFTPSGGTNILFGAWVKEQQDCACIDYTNNNVVIVFKNSSGATITSTTLKPSGNIIEGWQRYENVIPIPANAYDMTVSFQSTNASIPAYFDDVRMLPFNAHMKSYVYDATSLRLMAELDENNYASFYEYDNDGTLIRVNKETEKGIQTIKETRSSLYKEY